MSDKPPTAEQVERIKRHLAAAFRAGSYWADPAGRVHLVTEAEKYAERAFDKLLAALAPAERASPELADRIRQVWRRHTAPQPIYQNEDGVVADILALMAPVDSRASHVELCHCCEGALGVSASEDGEWLCGGCAGQMAEERTTPAERAEAVPDDLVCDCQQWPTHVSNECPVHNLIPDADYDETRDLTAEEEAMVDAAWEKHKAAAPTRAGALDAAGAKKALYPILVQICGTDTDRVIGQIVSALAAGDGGVP